MCTPCARVSLQSLQVAFLLFFVCDCIARASFMFNFKTLTAPQTYFDIPQRIWFRVAMTMTLWCLQVKLAKLFSKSAHIFPEIADRTGLKSPILPVGTRYEATNIRFTIRFPTNTAHPFCRKHCITLLVSLEQLPKSFCPKSARSSSRKCFPTGLRVPPSASQQETKDQACSKTISRPQHPLSVQSLAHQDTFRIHGNAPSPAKKIVWTASLWQSESQVVFLVLKTLVQWLGYSAFALLDLLLTMQVISWFRALLVGHDLEQRELNCSNWSPILRKSEDQEQGAPYRFASSWQPAQEERKDSKQPEWQPEAKAIQSKSQLSRSTLHVRMFPNFPSSTWKALNKLDTTEMLQKSPTKLCQIKICPPQFALIWNLICSKVAWWGAQVLLLRLLYWLLRILRIPDQQRIQPDQPVQPARPTSMAGPTSS